MKISFALNQKNIRIYFGMTNKKLLLRGVKTMEISCSICRYGESHDYLNRWYCRNKNCYQSRCFDQPEIFNCPHGEFDFEYMEFRTDEICLLKE